MYSAFPTALTTACVLASASPPFAAESGRLGGNSETCLSATRAGEGEEGAGQYFENWTDLSYQVEEFRFDLGYEAHLPPAPSSRDTAGQGIYQRTFTYSDRGFAFKAGHYLARLGNGLTLQAQRNRDIGMNTNLDGVLAEYASSRIEGKALSGSPRDAAGKRYAALRGGELRLALPQGTILGTTLVTTRTARDPHDYWGSLYGGADGGRGNLRMEWAARSFADNPGLGKLTRRFSRVFPQGQALYAMGNLLLGPVSLFAEGRYYRDFNLFEGAVYNNPPSGIKEHVFSLPNKRQLLQNADNEKGIHLGAEYAWGEERLLSFDYSRTHGVGREFLLYEEYYGQFETALWGGTSAIVASGIQTDLEGRNLNFILHPSLPLGETYALKAEWQHQHTTILLTDRMYYGQQYVLSLERSPGLVLSLITETATDQLEKNPVRIGEVRLWSGGQVNWTFLDHHDIALFAGTRRKGKVCAGGVCLLKPELKGFELTLNSHF